MNLNEKLIKPISYNDAAGYLLEMAKNEAVLSKMDGCISGVFKADKLEKWVSQKNVHGILFWFCNTNPSKVPYLAIQKIKEEYSDDPSWLASLFPNRPVMHNKGLRMVKDVIKKDYSKNSTFDEILSDIQNENPIEPSDFDFRDSGSVDEKRNQFRRNFADQVEFPFAYFSTKYGEGKSYFKQFFEQGGSVPIIRYYLGYSTEPVFNGQQIRLILAPCKADGSNLKNHECAAQHLSQIDGAILLQNSWPPKPQNLTE